MLKWIVNNLLGRKARSRAHKRGRAPTQHCPAISFELVADTTPSRSSILLKQATAKKKGGDLDAAILLLREAYAEIAQTGAIEKPATFLRLPMYLQEAGRPDEAWGEFNAMLAGHYPLDMRDPAFAPLWQSQIYDKMRLFLQREKKNDKAVFFGVLSYLAYGKWLAYQAATEEFPELRDARKDEFREQTSTERIEQAMASLLKKARLGEVTADLTRVMRRHLERGKSLSLSQANKDVRAVLSQCNSDGSAPPKPGKCD